MKRTSYTHPCGERESRDSAGHTKRLDLTCPTCKRPGALTPNEAKRGYQCRSCADNDEGGF